MKTIQACFIAILLGAALSAHATPAEQLQAQYTALAPRLAANPFNRPLVLDSQDSQNRPQGDIYAVVNYPFATVNTALNNAGHWCDVMLLHINTKYCHPVSQGAATQLRLYVGKKTPQELADADRIDFTYTPVAAAPDYFEVALDAKQGPLGTSGYRIVLQAVALDAGKTFLHLSYGYNMNFSARMATQVYLGTVGRGKIGFTQARKPDGKTEYVGGVRGIVERNTMRYYLAIDSYLAASKAPAPQQWEASLQSWFSASETYAHQLHEMDRGEYLAMKRDEYARQQVLR